MDADIDNIQCKDIKCFMSGLIKRNPGERVFHQAVREVAESLIPSAIITRNIKRLRFWNA
jgi:hypothetical protein